MKELENCFAVIDGDFIEVHKIISRNSDTISTRNTHYKSGDIWTNIYSEFDLLDSRDLEYLNDAIPIWEDDYDEVIEHIDNYDEALMEFNNNYLLKLKKLCENSKK